MPNLKEHSEPYPPEGVASERDAAERSASVLIRLRRYFATETDHARLLEQVLDQPELPVNVALRIRLHLNDRVGSEADAGGKRAPRADVLVVGSLLALLAAGPAAHSGAAGWVPGEKAVVRLSLADGKLATLRRAPSGSVINGRIAIIATGVGADPPMSLAWKESQVADALPSTTRWRFLKTALRPLRVLHNSLV